MIWTVTTEFGPALGAFAAPEVPAAPQQRGPDVVTTEPAPSPAAPGAESAVAGPATALPTPIPSGVPDWIAFVVIWAGAVVGYKVRGWARRSIDDSDRQAAALVSRPAPRQRGGRHRAHWKTTG